MDYYIEIAGVDGTSGSLHLSVTTAPVPVNDDFTSATSVSLASASSTFVDQQSIAAATWQYYEALPCYIGTDSVWYSYTPSFTHRLHISTYGSDFDSVVVVYNGSSLTSLSAIACNDNAEASTKASLVSLDVTSGTTYRIQVAPYLYKKGGNLRLQMSGPQENDDFEQARSLDNLLNDLTKTVTATVQAPETGGSCGGPYKTVWYKVSPTSDTRYTLSTVGSNFGVVLTVYTGSTLSTLTEVACKNENQASLTFEGDAGATYYIRASGTAAQNSGDLLISAPRVAIRAGDSFTKAVEITSSLPVTTTASDNTNATTQSTEPTSCLGIGRSIWLEKTLAAGTYTASTIGSAPDTTLAVYRAGSPNNLANLTSVGCSDNYKLSTTASLVTFEAAPSGTYYFQLDTKAAPGAATLKLEQDVVPTNDLIANATSLSSAHHTDWYMPEARTGLATTSGESALAGCPALSKTVWFTFTTTKAVLVGIDLAGSNFSTGVELYYQGPSGSLTSLNCAGTQMVQRLLTAGTYYIRAGGVSGASGVLQMHFTVWDIPANDNLADAIAISPTTTVTTVDNYPASMQTSEPTKPAAFCGNMAKSVWFKYQPTVSEFGSIDTLQSTPALFDTTVAVFRVPASTTPTFTNLEFVDCNNDITYLNQGAISSGYHSSVAFPIVETFTYYIQVGGPAFDFNELKFRFQEFNQPDNDVVGGATNYTSPVVATTLSSSLKTVIASREPEHMPCGNIGATLWYKYVATTSGTRIVTLDTYEFRSVVAVYVQNGTAFQNISCQGQGSLQPQSISLSAVLGTTYYIQVGGIDGDAGGFGLSIT